MRRPSSCRESGPLPPHLRKIAVRNRNAVTRTPGSGDRSQRSGVGFLRSHRARRRASPECVAAARRGHAAPSRHRGTAGRLSRRRHPPRRRGGRRWARLRGCLGEHRESPRGMPGNPVRTRAGTAPRPPPSTNEDPRSASPGPRDAEASDLRGAGPHPRRNTRRGLPNSAKADARTNGAGNLVRPAPPAPEPIRSPHGVESAKARPPPFPATRASPNVVFGYAVFRDAPRPGPPIRRGIAKHASALFSPGQGRSLTPTAA